MYKKSLFNDGWEFAKVALGSEYSDALSMSKVDIPHDWLIYDVKKLYETSTGWYRKYFTVDKKDGENICIRFEGVYMDSRVYVNGKKAGEWKYGYSTFEYDITELVQDGENIITVRVDYQSPNSRWYSGAGIYRDVFLITRPESHLVSDGVYISADIDGTITISAETEYSDKANISTLCIRHEILNGNTLLCSAERPCCAADISSIPEAVRRNGFSYANNSITLKVENPVLWEIESPFLYECRTTLLSDDNPLQTVSNCFGFRKAEFSVNNGFLLNGHRVKLHGSCEHHDLGALGAAFNKSGMKRKLVKLRSMGVNAIRTSHNMPAKGLMELADEMGFLIVSESFDMWERPKTEYDYHRFFKEWVDKDVASWVRRDRNHPSLIAWSIGNEIYDTHVDKHGQEITSLLTKLVRLHDYRKNGYVTIGSNYMQWDNAQKCADIVKIAGYNYGERLYDEQHEKYPDWCIYGSETASCIQSRGIYHFPYTQSMLCNDDKQCSSLGNSTTGWGAANTEACIIADRDAEYCAGQFIWTGFDYIGEPTPYDTKNSFFGQIDTAGFFKDSGYIFRAEWTDYKKSPFVHIFPYWDFTEGEDIDVRVTTNAPKTALFLNGKLIASKDIDHKHGKELTLNACVPYTKGELTAIAYDENDNEIARDIKKSFDDATSIRFVPENNEAAAGSRDLLFVEINVCDKNGIEVENANNRIFVDVSGAGRLVGLDNGNSADYEQYKGTSRRLFSGKLLAIIAPTEATGDIYIKASSKGLEDAFLTLKSNEGVKEENVTFIDCNTHTTADCPNEENDIPVRKIAFLNSGKVFSEAKNELSFKAEIYPESSTYSNEIEYRITNVLGIESNLAKIVSVTDNNVRVRCKGDGEFYLRALCKNGTSGYHIISTLKLRGENLGAAVINPYEFVSAGLYTMQSGNIGNGIEKGVGFASGESGWFAFENVDFGEFGSDTITLPMYANNTTPVFLKVYDGIPNKGGKLLGEFKYHVPPVWLTYQNAVYKLNKRLSGIKTIAFESSNSYHIKGFKFALLNKSFSEIAAAECMRVYGDSFELGERLITGIGNNVMIDFGEFDFTAAKPKKIVISGKSDVPMNSIHIIIRGNSEKRILTEFEQTNDYIEKEFDVDIAEEKCNISLAFLPGSRFNLKSICFV